MKSQTKSKSERKYFIDWLRITLIISVFFYHLGMIFRTEQWHVNSAETFEFLEPIMRWLSLWRMPLLFLVSGIGTYYALGFRTTKQYVKERITRLYIPLSVGFFTLVPMMVYVERIDNYSSLWDYYPHMFDGGPYPVGNISWHHLWFLVYLLFISLAIAPFIKYTRSNHFKQLRNKLVAITSKRGGLNWMLPILIGSQLILRHYYPNHSHALFNDWAYVVYYFLFFAAGFILFTNDMLINALARQRRLYLKQTIIFSILIYTVSSIFSDPMVIKYAYAISTICFAWSCGLTATGYARIYLNKEHKYRKILNEAIYPFYLLHQPALIFVGYVVLKWDISYGLQALLITGISLVSIIITYWFVIRKFNVLRIAFGLKRKQKREPSKIANLESAIAYNK